MIIVDGAEVRRLREASDLSRHEFCRLADRHGNPITSVTLYQIERGHTTQILASTLYVIAAVLRVPMEALIQEQMEASA